MLQIILTLVIFVLLIIPIGRYMFHIATGQHTFCDPVFNRIDNGIYRICGINQNEGMGWKKYALALVLTNAVMVFIGYLILRIQFLPVFNPNGIGHGAHPLLQHHYLLHDQHQPAALLR